MGAAVVADILSSSNHKRFLMQGNRKPCWIREHEFGVVATWHFMVVDDLENSLIVKLVVTEFLMYHHIT